MAGIFISCFPIFSPNMSGISAENMGLTLTGASIDKCHRFGRTGNMRLRPIIIRFVKISIRDIILQNAKKLRNGHPNTQVYINEISRHK